jgi:hypothetical protein
VVLEGASDTDRELSISRPAIQEANGCPVCSGSVADPEEGIDEEWAGVAYHLLLDDGTLQVKNGVAEALLASREIPGQPVEPWVARGPFETLFEGQASALEVTAGCPGAAEPLVEESGVGGVHERQPKMGNGGPCLARGKVE